MRSTCCFIISSHSVHGSTRSTFFMTKGFSSSKCQSFALVLSRVISVTSIIWTSLIFSISLFSRWSGPGRTSFRRSIRPRRKHHRLRTWCLYQKRGEKSSNPCSTPYCYIVKLYEEMIWNEKKFWKAKDRSMSSQCILCREWREWHLALLMGSDIYRSKRFYKLPFQNIHLPP